MKSRKNFKIIVNELQLKAIQTYLVIHSKTP